MRKLWGILLLVLACNVTSLVARISMLDTLTADHIQCYIGAQEEGAPLAEQSANYAFDNTKSVGMGMARTLTSENSPSKNLPLTYGRLSQAEYHQGLFGIAFTSSQSTSHGPINRRVKDLYIYALRRIII